MGDEMPDVQADGGPVTKNDQRVLNAVRDACETWDGFIPHGAPDHLGIKRLLQARVVEFVDYGGCETCCEYHEAPIYRLAEGK